MKTNKLSFFAVILLVLAVVAPSFAQMTQECKDMNEDIFFVKRDSLKQLIGLLEKTNSTLQSDIDAYKKNLNSIQSYDDCQKEIQVITSNDKKNAQDKKKSEYEKEIKAFTASIKEVEGKIDRNECPKASRQAELDALKKNNLSARPEFFRKVTMELQAKIDKMVCEVVKKNENYKVVPGDCLWCIAARDKFYGNGFAWPAIYNANKSLIKDPNLIYPNWELKIPDLTPAEKTQYDKLRGNYKPAPTK